VVSHKEGAVTSGVLHREGLVNARASGARGTRELQRVALAAALLGSAAILYTLLAGYWL
jgi:hypothetical protein